MEREGVEGNDIGLLVVSPDNYSSFVADIYFKVSLIILVHI